MDTVDAVARALADAIWGGSPLVEDAFGLLSDGEQDTYRRWAQAAIDAHTDALGLKTVTGLASEYPEGDLYENDNGTIVVSRLVSGWVRKDNTNE